MGQSLTKKNIDVIGVPSDLGANIRGANMGPAAIRIARLKEKIELLGHKVTDQGDINVPIREQISQLDQDQKYLDSITEGCQKLKETVYQSYQRGNFPLVIGGDHSYAVGTLAAAQKYCDENKKKLGVVWIDAHADINTPNSSYSKNIHGMPVAVCLGNGHKNLVSIFDKQMKNNQFSLIGLRDIDGPEKEELKKSGVHYYTMRKLDELSMFEVMKKTLDDLDADVYHLSFDLDGIDPMYAPGVSTAVTGGLSYREAHLALEMLADTNKLISAEFVELNPKEDESHKTARLAVELIQSTLGKSIV